MTFTGIGQCPSASGIPIFYHCEPDSVQRDNGALDGAAGAFAEGDEVIVQCEIVSSAEYKPLYVMGFVDKPKGCGQERIYVSMKSSLVSIKRCFVWDIKENAYATIPDNEGNPVTFPCDPEDISDWYDAQESIGEALLRTYDCGRYENSFFSTCNVSSSHAEPSGCDPSFTDTASCVFTESAPYDCRPGTPPYFHQAQDWQRTIERHLIWGKTVDSQHAGSERITFRNNCDEESVFKLELTSNAEEYIHDSEDTQCALECDNRTENTSETKGWQFILPLGSSIFEINASRSVAKDLCANTWLVNAENELVTWGREFKPGPVRLKTYGVYTEKNIAQVYFVEVQTRDYSYDGEYFGGSGETIEEYAFRGLKLAAQVDTLTGTEYPDGTDGVDPTILPRNVDLETAVSGLYDILRADIFEATTGLEESDTIGASLNAFLILKGAINP